MCTKVLLQRNRAILIDTLICVLFPLIYIALRALSPLPFMNSLSTPPSEYIVQGHRFNIYEDIGCFPALYNTLPTYFISNMWPLLIGLISAVYCGGCLTFNLYLNQYNLMHPVSVLTLRSFARRRLEFSQFINSNNSSMTISRYFRLMALAMSAIFLTVPLGIFTIWLNATAQPIGPWRSWSDTHFDFSRIEQIPAVIWQSSHIFVIAMEFTRWIVPICAIVFFAFFGFADEAKKNYRKVFWAIAKPLGFEPHKPSAFSKGIPSIGLVIHNIISPRIVV